MARAAPSPFRQGQQHAAQGLATVERCVPPGWTRARRTGWPGWPPAVLSVVWVPLKATRTSRWPGRLSARGAPRRVDQAAGGGGGRAAENFLHRAFLYHGAFVQDGDAVADLLHHAHLVGDDHHRDAQFAVDLLDQLQDGVGGVGVQRAGGFVAQQHLGVGGQGRGRWRCAVF